MIETFIIGISGIVFMMLLWVWVQSRWRDVFSDHIEDEDVLAHRTSCGNCGCTTICREKGKTLKKEIFKS